MFGHALACQTTTEPPSFLWDVLPCSFCSQEKTKTPRASCVLTGRRPKPKKVPVNRRPLQVASQTHSESMLYHIDLAKQTVTYVRIPNGAYEVYRQLYLQGYDANEVRDVEREARLWHTSSSFARALRACVAGVQQTPLAIRSLPYPLSRLRHPDHHASHCDGLDATKHAWCRAYTRTVHGMHVACTTEVVLQTLRDHPCLDDECASTRLSRIRSCEVFCPFQGAFVEEQPLGSAPPRGDTLLICAKTGLIYLCTTSDETPQTMHAISRVICVFFSTDSSFRQMHRAVDYLVNEAKRTFACVCTPTVLATHTLLQVVREDVRVHVTIDRPAVPVDLHLTCAYPTCECTDETPIPRLTWCALWRSDGVRLCRLRSYSRDRCQVEVAWDTSIPSMLVSTKAESVLAHQVTPLTKPDASGGIHLPLLCLLRLANAMDLIHFLTTSGLGRTIDATDDVAHRWFATKNRPLGVNR